MNSEKVIKELENLQDSIATNRMPDAHKAIGIISDALDLLKEQEKASKRNPVIVCPHCGKRVK